jgi:hypothetical protein
MEQYVNRIWGENEDDVRRLIILDQARVHTMQAAQNKFREKETDIVFVPAGCTSLVQPADVSWNHPFKNKMRDQWRIWRQNEFRTPAGNLKSATRQEVISWISHAWASVTPEIIIRSYQKCGISLNLDGSEDHLMSDQLRQATAGEEMNQEALELLFESDLESEEEFTGFSDTDE